MDTFCWLVLKRHKRDQCLFFTVDSEKEGSEDGDVLGVSSRFEASPELMLSSSMLQ